MSLSLPEEIKDKVLQMTALQKNYCEFRAKGLSQAGAAKKAGSASEDRNSLARFGYGIENDVEGAKEYIRWLQDQRSATQAIDESEIIIKLRDIYSEALVLGRLGDAVKSVELMGNIIGLFKAYKDIPLKADAQKTTKNNTDAFKEEENETTERLEKLQQMMKDLNKT